MERLRLTRLITGEVTRIDGTSWRCQFLVIDIDLRT